MKESKQTKEDQEYVWSGGQGKGCKFLKGQWEWLYEKRHLGKILK